MLTTTEAAIRLGVKVRRVQQMIAAGQLTAQRHGGVWLIDERAIERAARRPKAGRPRK